MSEVKLTLARRNEDSAEVALRLDNEELTLVLYDRGHWYLRNATHHPGGGISDSPLHNGRLRPLSDNPGGET